MTVLPLWRWRVLDPPTRLWYRHTHCRRHGHHTKGGSYCLTCGKDQP